MILCRAPWMALLLLSAAVLSALIFRAELWGSATPRLENSCGSLEEVAAQFLKVLETGEMEAARELAITRDEFERYVWPQLPASASGTNLSVDFLWQQTEFKSINYLKDTLQNHAGKSYELVEVRSAEGIKEYGSFRTHRDMRVRIRTPEGKEQELNLFGSILEMDGEFKLYSFVR